MKTEAVADSGPSPQSPRTELAMGRRPPKEPSARRLLPQAKPKHRATGTGLFPR